MENDEPRNINLIEKNNLTSTSVFKFEYKDQNVNNIIEYQKWKELMLKEFGNNSKQYRCNKDKILFFSRFNECMNEYYYKCRCPICNNYICYFCSFNGNENYNSCCIKNIILKSIFYIGPNSVDKPFDVLPLFVLIPLLNYLILVFFF